MVTDRLRIEPTLAPVINDYRIHDGHVEVRTLDHDGHSFDSQLSNWRRLNSSELELHFVLSTVVAKWVQHTHPELHPPERGSEAHSELVM